jgi:hypothetical protein
MTGFMRHKTSRHCLTAMREDPMGNKRRPKADASAVNDAKKKAETEPRGGTLRRAAKAKKKASARETKVQQNFHKRSRELDAALMALEKTDVGSPQAREVEKAARVALKAVLVQRKKLRKARKALRRAAAKERKAQGRTPVAAAIAAPRQAPAAQSRKASKKRPAKKLPASEEASGRGPRRECRDETECAGAGHAARQRGRQWCGGGRPSGIVRHKPVSALMRPDATAACSAL